MDFLKATAALFAVVLVAPWFWALAIKYSDWVQEILR